MYASTLAAAIWNGPAVAQTIVSGDDVKAAFADKTAYIAHRNGNTHLSTERKCYTVKRLGNDKVELQSTDFKR
jgi:hypothetical protein